MSAALIAAEGLSKKFAVKQGGLMRRKTAALWAVDDVNFAASVVSVATQPTGKPSRRTGLPMAPGASISSFGR